MLLRNNIMFSLVVVFVCVVVCTLGVVVVWSQQTTAMSGDAENETSSPTPVCLIKNCSFDRPPITVHLLRVHSSFATEARIDAAFGLFYERHPELRQQLDVQLVRKYSARDGNAASGEYAGYQLTLQKTFRSLNEDTNTTYLYISGPDGPQEARNVAMFTPLYNMITFSGFANAVVIGNRFVYPLMFRVCMTTVEFGLTQVHMVQMLGLESIAYVSLDEISDEQLSQGRRAVDASATDVVAIHVLNRENIDSMARALLDAQPDAILSAFGTWRGSQMICNLYRRGILNTDIVWIISGLFVTTDWWDRRPEQSGWNCTHEELIQIYNGSIAVDAFIEPPDGQSAAEIARRVDKINNRQVLARFNDERVKYGDGTDERDLVNPQYYSYDAVFSGLISLHRAAERVERERKGFLSSLKLYDSPEFQYWSSVLKEEIEKNEFYGATGFVQTNLGDRRHGITQATQFQATSNTTFKWVLIAQLDFTRNINHTWPERLKFSTTTSETPLVVKRARASAQHRTQLAWALAGGIVGLLLLTTILGIFIQRRRVSAQQDVSWLIVDPASRVSYVTPSAAKPIGGSRTMSWRARSTTSFTSATGSIAASQHHSEGNASQKSSVFGSAKKARDQILVWLDNVHQVHARTLATDTALTRAANLSPAQLNRSVFPQARAMLVLQHENVNRFFGIITPQDQDVAALSSSTSHGSNNNVIIDENDAAVRQHRYTAPEALFAFLAKGSIRTFLRDYSISLELEMQMLFLADISNGLLALHDAHVAHCLLHPNNLLLDERYTVKITDFGMAPFQQPRMLRPIVDATQQFSVVEDWKLAEQLLFRAPELLRQGIPESAPTTTLYDHSGLVVDLSKCDMYSMAYVFVEVLTRHLPFSKLMAQANSTTATTAAITNPDSIFDDNDDFNEGIELLQLINELVAPPSPSLQAKRPAYPPTLVSTALLDIISSCWHESAEYRPTAAQVSRLLKQVPGYQGGNVMQNLVKRLERYSRNLQVLVDERTELLENEMNKSETLLLELLPRSVMMELKSGRGVEPETFEMVSLYFSDLVSFTVLSSRSTPMETVQMLNSLFTLFDSTIAPLDVYKVETIGDAYMVASGVPLRNGHNHCAQIAVTALRLRDALQKQYTIPHLPGEALKIRIGLHCGPCVAGVVGLNMPRYCLFGDTVIMAQRMESTGLAMKIQTSSQFYVTLNTHLPHKFRFERRHRMSVSNLQLNATNKDHQEQLNDLTYWLVSENTSVVVKTIVSAARASVGSIGFSGR